MQIKRDFAGSTDMWPTSAGGQLIEVANLTGFTVRGAHIASEQYNN
jgi:UDP-N-acetylenolpyruvoylglucosamine reductase